MAGAALFLDVVMLEGGSNQARDAALLKERQDGRQDRHRRRRPYAHDGRRWSQTVFFWRYLSGPRAFRNR